ncbi:hypothetical protein [Solirhodobacter olei]|uniref:hypothetical protein n=1 Tax=Solirhodobacter olei TaxID=2493082 RepID=UPI000FD8D323|nr:hypothetical protein [Solirhodobacter olei]
MASRSSILKSPHWQHFVHREGFADLPTSVLAITDDFFRFIAEHGLAAPNGADLLAWAVGDSSAPARLRLLGLRQAMVICLPSFLAQIDEAIGLIAAKAAILTPAKTPADGSEVPSSRGGEPARPAFDPIAPPGRKPPVPRHVSVAPKDLPSDWQDLLRRIFDGLPGNDVMIAPEIAKRLREKLCQFAWSCRKAGTSVALTPSAINLYETDLRQRLKARKNGLRWASVRASIEELHRFARYAGLGGDVIAELASRLALLQSRENVQLALKHFELARTGNTIDRLLDMADGLLAGVAAVESPKKRHQLRNGAAILGIYANAPLRNHSADLRFGETLFWEAEHWVIRTKIHKTHSRNPELFVLRLEPLFGRYIDAVLLGDHSPSMLPKLRQEALLARRQLFVLFDGGATAPSYIPRIFKHLSGNSFTTTRTMTHTDCAVRYGKQGVLMAMAACHQVSSGIEFKYQQDLVMRNSVAQRRASGQARRSGYDQMGGGDLDLSFLDDREEASDAPEELVSRLR